MFGIFTGMKITLKHFFGPKVTRLYPYEKRVLPERTRGLIQYLVDEKGQFKCEGCLFCEKICPPQAITVNYRERETPRDRVLTLPQAVWGNFQRSRRALLSREGRPELADAQREPGPGEAPINWERVSACLGDGRRSAGGLAAALGEIQSTVGYLPRHAVTRLATETGIDLSTVYALASGVPGFRTDPVDQSAIVVCQCPVCRNAGAAELSAAVSAEVATKGGTLPRATAHTRCLGDVSQAPVLRVGGRCYGNLTGDGARQIVRQFLTGGGSPR